MSSPNQKRSQKKHDPDALLAGSVRKRNLTIFSSEQEDALLTYILKCSDHYYGLSRSELRGLAYQFAKKVNIEYPETWDADLMAGEKWYRNFMKRHKNLTLRSPEQTSLNRVKAFCPANVDYFFRKYDEATANIQYNASSIWNMYEIGFLTVPTKVGKVLSLKGPKKIGQICAAELGTMVTMALAVSAYGNSIPPFYLFPRKNMEKDFMDNRTDGVVGLANDSGCMQQPEFFKFMQHFIRHAHASKNSPVLLFVDNHSSYLSVEALDLAVENGVEILSIPPHCSHRMQPLDVSVYGPVKAFYKSQCSTWQTNNKNQVLEIRHIAGIVAKTLDLALTPKNIKAGFAATGIRPYNPDVFTESDFVAALDDPERLETIQIETELEHDEDNQRRIVMLKALKTEKKASKVPKATRRPATGAADTSSKRGKKKESPSSQSSQDVEFCIICLENMPRAKTRDNSIRCNGCHKPAHLKCADMRASYFTCPNCESEYETEVEEMDE